MVSIRSLTDMLPRIPIVKVQQPVRKERLERLYIVHKLSTIAIAARLGSNRESVRKLIHSYGYR